MATKTTGEANLWLPVMADTIPVTVEVHLKENFETIDEKITRLNSDKVEKVVGKALSTNDYDNIEKAKLAGIETNANKTIISNILSEAVAGKALDATQGKALKDELTEHKIDYATEIADVKAQIEGVFIGYNDINISNQFTIVGRISHTEGLLLTAVTTHMATDFIDVEDAEFIFRYVLDGTFNGKYIAYHIAFYDANKVFISGEYPNTTYDVSTYDGKYGIKHLVPTNAKYSRMSMLATNVVGGSGNDYNYLVVNPIYKQILREDYNTLEIQRIDEELAEINIKSHLQDKKIACFGDSIFGNFRDGTGITDVMIKNTGATIYNFGFGGTYISLRDGTNSQDIYWDEFSMVRIADYIASGDFTPMETALASMDSALSYFASAVAELKTINWNEIDIITIEQGTNDFTGHNLAYDELNLDDKLTYYGAYKYVIETILTSYSHLRIVLLTPTWRYWFDEQGVFIDDSDTRLMNAGIPLTDFVKVVGDIGKKYHLPTIDNYYELGLNKFTRNIFLQDGTHPNVEGRIRIGDRVSHMLLSIL